MVQCIAILIGRGIEVAPEFLNGVALCICQREEMLIYIVQVLHSLIQCLNVRNQVVIYLREVSQHHLPPMQELLYRFWLWAQLLVVRI